jgi:polar amino acid transport system substrate-binding protein
MVVGVSPPAIADADALAPTGVLRAIFLESNPVQGSVDAAGVVSGPAADLTRELARRHGIPSSVTPVKGTQAVIEGVKTGTADIGFLAFDPLRAAQVDFSQPYSLAYNAYLVPAGSPIQSTADVDRSGVRIGVGERDAADLYLTRTIKQAMLRRVAAGSVDTLVGVVTAGEVDAFATNRYRLAQALARIPGARILPDNFLAVEQAVIVVKGATARLAIIDRFLDDARGSGLIRAALARSQLTGVDVAPAKPH